MQLHIDGKAKVGSSINGSVQPDWPNERHKDLYRGASWRSSATVLVELCYILITSIKDAHSLMESANYWSILAASGPLEPLHITTMWSALVPYERRYSLNYN